MSEVQIETVDGTTTATLVTPTTAPAPPQAEVAEVVTPEVAAPAAPAEPEPEPEAEPDEPKKTKYQSRIDRLTAERYEAEARARVEAERRAQLEYELAQVRQGPPPPAPVDREPQRGEFEDDDAYIAALVSYRTRKEVEPVLAAVQQHIEAARQEQVRAEALRAYHERIAAARSELADFDEVTSRDLPVSAVMADVIVQSPVGPHLSYYLGSHPEECERLAKLPPIVAAREMGALEARLGAATTGTSPGATSRSIAPPPVKPVGGAPTTATVPLDRVSFSEFERIRNEQERARRSR